MTGLTTSAKRPLLHVRDEKSSGTNGGTFTAGAWRTHDLNTVATNEIGGAGLASNQITLPAGDYEIYAWGIGRAVNQFKYKLYDVTNAADLLIGSNGYIDSGVPGQAPSVVAGRISLAAATAIELQGRCTVTASGGGFGQSAAYSVAEVYAEILIWKV